MKHYLYSWNKELNVYTFDKFNKEAIKEAILDYLTAHPDDTLEHTKDMNLEDRETYYGDTEIINFYSVCPSSNKISKIVSKNGKDYFQPLDY